MNKKTKYEIEGVEVSGYRVGPYLAIRDKTGEYPKSFKRDIERETDEGKWVLEHLPTGKVVCRAHYKKDVEHVAAALDPDKYEYLASSDIAEVVDSMRRYLPSWLDRVQEQRTKMAGREP